MARSSGWTAAPQYNPLTANRQPQSLARRRFLNCPHLPSPSAAQTRLRPATTPLFAAVRSSRVCWGWHVHTGRCGGWGCASGQRVTVAGTQKSQSNRVQETSAKGHLPRNSCPGICAREDRLKSGRPDVYASKRSCPTRCRCSGPQWQSPLPAPHTGLRASNSYHANGLSALYLRKKSEFRR